MATNEDSITYISIPTEKPQKKKAPSRVVIVVAVVVVVGLVLASALYMWVLQFLDYEKISVHAELTCHYSKEDNFIVEVLEMNTEIAVTGVNYFLKNSRGEILENGTLADIYQLDMDFFPSSITFRDHEKDGQLSEDDYFILRSVKKGGGIREGQELQLKDRWEKDKTMGSVRLATTPIGKSYSEYKPEWNLTLHDEGNISFARQQSVASSNVSFHYRSIHFRARFSYIGDGERNLTVLFRDKNETLEEQPHQVASDENISFFTSYTHDTNDMWDYEKYPISFFVEVVDRKLNQTLLLIEIPCEFLRISLSSSPSFTTTPTITLITITPLFFACAARYQENRLRR